MTNIDKYFSFNLFTDHYLNTSIHNPSCCRFLGRNSLKKECDNLELTRTNLLKCGKVTLDFYKNLYENGYAIFVKKVYKSYWTIGEDILTCINYYSTTIPFDLAYENRDKLEFYYFSEEIKEME
jgi:hypothetical protein